MGLKTVKDWVEIVRTCNTSSVPDPKDTGLISKWLIGTRACVFSMTLLSGLIGITLAAIDLGVKNLPWITVVLVILGLMLAHAANNLINDYFDVLNKVDTPGYTRTEYAPHPLLSGLMTVKTLLWAVLLFDALDLVIAIWLSVLHGWLIMGFAAMGLALSVFYVAPPLKLKHHGMGELAIFFIWGPLIIGGTYLSLTNQLDTRVLLASIPYGVAIVGVVMGKHLDKLVLDRQRNVHTLPVILGEKSGRYAMIGVIILFYLSVIVLSVVKVLPWTALLVLFSVYRAYQVSRVLLMPMPESPEQAYQVARPFIPASLKDVFNPKGKDRFPLWPLWFVVWGVWWVRFAGGLLVLGLLAGLFI